MVGSVVSHASRGSATPAVAGRFSCRAGSTVGECGAWKDSQREPFHGLWSGPLYPLPREPLPRIEGDSPGKRAQVRTRVPREPGVYGMIDVTGRLLYVGKSKLLRNRLLSYFLPGNEEDKAGRIVQSTAAIVWESQPSEFAALLREQSLIRCFQPRFNVQGIPRRQQQVFVCLGRGPAEHLYTARRHDPTATAVLGPLSGAGRAARAVEVLNRLFRLRDCTARQPCSFAEQLQLFEIELRPGCIRLEIGSCLGPCIAACSRREYQGEVQRVQGFLAGRDPSPVESLQQAMLQAARQLQFEQAQRLREDLRAVEWLGRRAADLALARKRYTFVYPVKDQRDPSQPDIWYLIRHGLVEGALPAPVTAAQRSQTERLLRQWRQHPEQIGLPFTPRPETLALVASWFRNQRGELRQTFTVGRGPAESRQRQEKHNR